MKVVFAIQELEKGEPEKPALVIAASKSMRPARRPSSADVLPFVHAKAVR